MAEPARRHLISLNDLDDEDLRWIVGRGVEYALGHRTDERPLRNSVAGILFRKTSTRTRTSFSAGALRLGAKLINYGPGDLQENTGETIEDTAAVLSRMLDMLVVRTSGAEAELRAYAVSSRMAVINAMCADEHPTQALADLTTLTQRFGRVEGLRVLYVGEGNNTASALALALSRYDDTSLYLRTPTGYGLDQRFLDRAELNAKRSGALVEEWHDMAELPHVDVVYTTRWQTTGTVKHTEDWREVFAPFHVDAAVMAESGAKVFLHDLPAHRGEEVAAEVLDGPASLAFTLAENKYHSARAVLAWCAGTGTREDPVRDA